MKPIIAGIGLLTGLAAGAGLILAAARYPVAAAIVSTGAVALGLGLIIVATIAITSWWTRQTMQAGAELILQSHTDRWDAHKVGSLAQLIREGARIGREETGRAQPLAALPPPAAEEETWLPRLVEFELPGEDQTPTNLRRLDSVTD